MKGGGSGAGGTALIVTVLGVFDAGITRGARIRSNIGALNGSTG